MKPTYEELEKQLEDTRELLRTALERILKLEEQVNKNSKNSSKPPSSDQKANTSDPHKKKRKGKKGVNRKLVPPERVDQHVQCSLDNCPHCGSADLKLKKAVEILQQVELPEIRAIVTEYILQKFQCRDCKKNCSAELPEGVPLSAFGPKLVALLATLTGGYLLPKREAVQLIKDLYDIDIGLGSVPNIEERVTRALNDVCKRIHEFVLKSDLSTHFDETGWRNLGKRHYAWIACNRFASIFKIHRSRSGEAFESLVKGQTEFKAVTDRYAVYKRLEGSHQYCLAHLIRDFQKYAERAGPDKKLGEAIVRVFSKACKIHAEYREGNRSWKCRNQGLGQLKRKLTNCFADAMGNGSDDLAKICEKLWDESEHIWAFTSVEGMEPTNNLAERNIRNLVIRRKRSYGTRGERGKSFIESITSICITARQHGINIYNFITDAVSRYFSKIEAPFIAPEYSF
jgi:transposase